MVRELDDLKRQVAHLSSVNAALAHSAHGHGQGHKHGAPGSAQGEAEAHEEGMAAAAATNQPPPPPVGAGCKRLENVVLSMDKARQIFQVSVSDEAMEGNGGFLEWNADVLHAVSSLTTTLSSASSTPPNHQKKHTRSPRCYSGPSSRSARGAHRRQRPPPRLRC